MSRIWLPFPKRSLPVVTVAIGNERYDALIDTGAAVSLVAPEVAIGLGLKTLGYMPLTGVSGKQKDNPVVMLSNVRFASVLLKPCRAACCILSHLGYGIEIILGINAFADASLQFDFKENRVYLIE
jgi:predicted aspartyl protease